MKKRILLIAATTGYQTRMFAEAAERAAIELALATDRCHVLEDPWGDQAIPLRFEDPDGAAAAIAASARVDGIVAIGDRPAYIAALAATRLGIPYNSPDAAAACHNKYVARERLRAAGLPVPEFSRIAVDENPALFAAEASYPCVLKPLGLSASRGVIRVNRPAEFVAAFERIRAMLKNPEILRLRDQTDGFIQVEGFIEGREFALEGFLDDGELRTLALFDKPDPLDGPFFEETIYVRPSREDESVQRAIVETTRGAVKALGLTHGPVHAEMRVNAKGVWMLEVAARPIGGLCAKVLPGLEELILRHAAGETIGRLPLNGAGGVMMIPIPREGVYAGVMGLEEAAGEPGITEVIITAKDGQKLTPLPEGNSYLGFIFSRAETPNEAEQALRRAHSLLEFSIHGVLAVV